MPIGQIAQAGSGLFGGQVALSFGQKLVTDHELLHGGRTQQGWVEVGVQLPVWCGRRASRPKDSARKRVTASSQALPRALLGWVMRPPTLAPAGAVVGGDFPAGR